MRTVWSGGDEKFILDISWKAKLKKLEKSGVGRTI
jgi:hypothetical protein